MKITVEDYLVEPSTAGAETTFTLPEVFSATVGDDPDTVALIDGDELVTWRQWEERAFALARALQELGVEPGDVVAVQLPNRTDFLVLHVAIAMIGAVLLPLNVGCGRSDLESLTGRTTPAVTVLPGQWRGNDGEAVARALKAAVPGLGPVILAGHDAEVPGSLANLAAEWSGHRPEPAVVRPESPFVLLGSSGTTSMRPKICLHSHTGLLSNAMTVVSDSDAVPGSEVMLSASPFSFLFGMLAAHVGIFTRARQVLQSSWDVKKFLAKVAAHQATRIYAVPTQLRDILGELAANPIKDLPRLREIRTGGAPVPEKLVRALSPALAEQVTVQWGMSELGAGTYTRPGDPAETVSRTVGRPATGARARVTGENDQLLPPGEVGELQFHSPTLFRGYYGDPELTAHAFTPDGWLRTGDLASIDSTGLVHFRGRASGLINVGGRKVNSAEIEQLLGDFEPLHEAVLAGRPDERLGEVPVLVCSVRNGHSITVDAVRKHLSAKGVATYQLPVEVHVVGEMPHTATGKIARRRAQELARPVSGGRPPAIEGATRGERLKAALTRVCDLAAQVVGEPVRPDDNFKDSGFDSAGGTRLCAALREATGADLPDTLIFDYPTPMAVARLLAGEPPERLATPTVTEPAVDPAEDDLIAIVGMGCRLPGGITSPEEFWKLLDDGREVRSELPTDRGWPLDRLYSDEPAAPGTINSRHGGFLSAITDFDAEFFSVDARDARSMDPQQRLLLETVWETLERTGLTADELRGSDTSVFVGMMPSDYAPRWFESPQSYDGTLGLGVASSVASGRISYLLGLHGSSLTVDTACSSSLVALHLAGQALRKRETGMAIVAGLTVMSSPANLVEFSRQSLLAPDGRCKPFAEDADGVGLSEGAGVVVLQRLSQARRQGRKVLAVIRSGAVTQDGASNGLTAPNRHAQELVIRRALGAAGLAATDIDAVEAHGTGTRLGDSIETQALRATYGEGRPSGQPLWLGSVKSNLGHTQAAAGIISVIKMVLALRHSTLPRTLHAESPRGDLGPADQGLRLLTESVSWPPAARPRRAAVSSFGISGTNAHLILEEAPETAGEISRPASASLAPWVISAKNPDTVPVAAAALDATVSGLVGSNAGVSAAGIGQVLATGRTHFRHRAAVIPSADGHYLPALHALATRTESPSVVTGTALEGSITFVFPGHGTQWPGMGTELLDDSPVFAEKIEECEKALAPYVPWSLSAVLRGEPGAPSMDSPDVAQPVSFAVMVALAALWRSYGVHPDAIAGHSQGEVAAAHVAGGLSLDDATRIIVTRGELMTKVDGQGGIAAVPLDPAAAGEAIAPWGDKLCVAVINAPRSVAIAGETDAVTEFVEHARSTGVQAKRLIGGIAFHSPQMARLEDDFKNALAGIKPVASAIPFHSGTTGTAVATETMDTEYWYRNIRDQVDFGATTKALIAADHQVFIEVSPHPVLSQAVEETIAHLGVTARTVTTLRRDQGGMHRFLRSLAEAHVHGAPVKWTKVFGEGHAGADLLPTYPFRRRRFWLEPVAGRSTMDTLPEAPQPEVGAVGEHGRLLTLPEPERLTALLDLVRTTVASVLELENTDLVTTDSPFESLGVSSLAAVEVRNLLSSTLETSLPATIVLDQGTPEKLAHYLVGYLAWQESESPRERETTTTTVVETAQPVETASTQPELPHGFEAMYRRLCGEGKAEAAWEMVHVAAGMRSVFSASDDLGQLDLTAFRQVVGRREPTLVCVPSVVSLAGRAEYKNFAAPFTGMHDVVQLGEPGTRDGESLPADLDALVAAYLEAVDRQVAAGPVLLCGRSFGGWIAQAMASRMTELGRPPVGVVLLDTFWPGEEFVRKFIPRTLRRLADRQNELGTELGITRLTAIGWYLRMLANWEPEPSGAPTLYVLPEDQTSIEQHLRSGGWRLPHTEVSIPADHFSILDSDASATAEAVESWLSTLDFEGKRHG